MAKRLLMVVGLAVLCGIVAGLVWGRLVGAGLGMAVALIGAIVVVLVRNQKDLHELEHGHVPRRWIVRWATRLLLRDPAM